MASSVNLGERLESFIDGVVRTGRYRSRSEVLREGVRLVQEREAKLARFEAEIMKGVGAIERGDLIDLDEAFDQVRESIRNAASRRAA